MRVGWLIVVDFYFEVGGGICVELGLRGDFDCWGRWIDWIWDVELVIFEGGSGGYIDGVVW